MARRTKQLRRAAGLTAVVLALTACVAGSADGAASPPASSATAAPSPTEASERVPAGGTLLALGDVGDCRAGGDAGAATAELAATLDGPIVLLGDIAYPSGTRADYRQCFWPSWRPLRDRVRAVMGNHDDRSRSTFYDIWPDGSSRTPWYAFTVDSWRVLVVDTTCTRVGCGPRSDQTRWLERRLAADPSRCTVVAMHHPRWSSDDEHGDDPAVDALWRAAYRGGADLVVAGHAHGYERIGPVGAAGKPRAGGPVLLVVGTGGAALRGFADVTPASQVRLADTFGLARLELQPDGWSAQFLAAPSGEVRDAASGSCRAPT